MQNLPGPVDHDPNAHHFAAVFAVRSRRQRIANYLLLAWVLLVTLFVVLSFANVISLPPGTSGMMVVPFYFLPVLCHAIFSMINDRCPRCNRNQSRTPKPRFCFNCGLRFRE